MPMDSAQIQQQIMMQQQMAMQQMQNAQMLSQRFGTHMGALNAMQHGAGGVYGEHLAQRLGNMGQTAIGMGGFGLGLAGMFTGMPLDPFSAAFSAGRVGMGMGGLAGGILGAGIGAAPFYLASQAARTYGGAFFGGMNQQSQLNATLRPSFNFSGGQGAFGRGFSQAQMGQIGQMVSQETRTSPFTSSQEMNDLISGGAESGMFTAVRDVQQFSQRFRTMIDSLRKIQKELGGTLSEALQFTRQSQAVGVFSQGSRQAFAADMRDTMATTGMSQDQLFNLAAQGSMLSRATGGVGRQGAVGALRMARTLGSALGSGVINQEALSEATGGLTGTDAIQAFTGRMLQQTERFSRRGMGRFSIFALSNAEGTGLDEGMVDRFLSGDISTSEVSRSAHGRVNRMGRAKAMNREGMLRGSLMEQGGLAGQIGMMRLMVGDRVMDQGDDLASLVLQRRFGMGRAESEVMMSLMRNQGTIAQNEGVERALAGRETRLRQDISENRSVDAFMEHLQHGLQDATGVTRVREMGRNFMTKISSLAERAMNDVLGIQASSLTVTDRQSMQRLTMGMATRDDIDRLQMGGGGAAGRGADPFSKPLAQRVLSGLGLHAAESVGEAMRARGVNLAGMTPMQQDAAIRAVERAQTGRVDSMGDVAGLSHLMKDRGDTTRRLASAELIASVTGDKRDLYRGLDASNNAIDAFRARAGLGAGIGLNTASLLGQGDDVLAKNAGLLGLSGLKGSVLGGQIGGLGGPLTTILGGLLGGGIGTMLGAKEAFAQTDAEKALGFISRGGHFMRGISAAQDLSGDTAKKFFKKTGISADEADKLAGFEGVDQDKMQAVLESESFQSSVRRLQRLKGSPEAQQKELAAMEIEAAKNPNKQAALLAVRELRHNIQMNKGSVGGEFLTMGDKRRQELQALARESGSKFLGLAEGMSGEMGGALRKIGESFYGYDVEGAAGQLSELQTKIAGMDVNSAEYQALVKDIGTDETGRSLLRGGSMERAFTRDVMGGGRRGRAQQAETALGSITGGALSGMEFKIGKRTLSSRNQARAIFESFRSGDKNADDLEKQLARQLGELGVSDAAEKVQEFRGMVKGGIDDKEATAIFKKFEQDSDLQRIRQQGMEKMQRDRDPLGVERNNLLGEIRTGINKLVEAGGGGGGEGVNMSNPG